MNRREAIRAGVVAPLCGGLTQVANAQPRNGGAGQTATIAEAVLAPAARLGNPTMPKLPGLLVILDCSPPREHLPYDVSLFLQKRQPDASWEDVRAAESAIGRSYTSAAFPRAVVDFSIVRTRVASVSFFIPYDATELASLRVGAHVGVLRLCARFFLFHPEQDRYVHDSAFDAAFAARPHVMDETGFRSFRGYGEAQRSQVLWNLERDEEWR